MDKSRRQSAKESKAAKLALWDELVEAFDSTRMGEKGINQGCWCVSSPSQTNLPDWKHNSHCKKNMALLKRIEQINS